ncbi:MAG TPA: acyltransferase [Catalimonadaceae bacterium]|mgnify:CR=1 FL=1|nr:acyltransferase [Catalimonadaceae bacterium]
MDKQKIYFPNLNGLRFIAAFLVIIHHIEQFKSLTGHENYWRLIPFIMVIGKLGVILFFVLSGFLITYLLLAEEKSFQTISVPKFYIRRMLRIWPLYFLVIGLAFFVLPHISLFTLPGFTQEVVQSNLIWKLLLYAVFFPNLVLSLLGVVPYASHTWSIGTEEQYYLVWPVAIKYVRKFRIGLMALIISGYLLFEYFLTTPYSGFIPYRHIVQAFWHTFNIDCMAIGGIFAILLFEGNPLLKYLQNRMLFYACLVLVSALMVKGVVFQHFHYETYALFFGIIILNFASNPRIGISMENPVLNYLGNISYGLYMYHPIGIMLAMYLAQASGFFTNWVLYPLSIALTIALAGASYRWYETYFLQFKHRFSKIISGADTKKAA